MKTQHTCNQR